MELCLRTILCLSQTKNVVRVKDISDSLNVKMPSVTAVLNSLKNKGMVVHESYGNIELTRIGEKHARNSMRTLFLKNKFLRGMLGVSGFCIESDIKNLEFCLSPETFERLLDFVEFSDICLTGKCAFSEKNLSEYMRLKRMNAEKGAAESEKISETDSAV